MFSPSQKKKLEEVGIYLYQGRIPENFLERDIARRMSVLDRLFEMDPLYQYKQTEEGRKVIDSLEAKKERELKLYRRKKEIDFEFQKKIFEMEEHLLDLQKQMIEEHDLYNLQSLKDQADFYAEQIKSMKNMLEAQ